jgi:predicted dehydrogenase
MAIDLAGCDRMIAVADRAGTVLAVGHQRRLHNRFIKARELIDAGAIGDVVQIGVFNDTGDLLSSSTHMVDVMRFLLHDAPAEWVVGQIDRRDPGLTSVRVGRPGGLQQWDETRTRYGHHIETGAIGSVHFRGGAQGLIEVGIVTRDRRPPHYSAVIYGTDGIIETAGDRRREGEAWLRARVKGEPDWITPETEENDAIKAEIDAIFDVIEHGGTHPLDMRSARQNHEILMAIYESARRRARIDLPYTGLTNPLEDMVAAGEI